MVTDRVQFNRRDKATDPFVMHDIKLHEPTGWRTLTILPKAVNLSSLC